MNLGLQLALGGLRKRSASPSSGTTVPMAADFKGVQNVNITSLEISDFTIVPTYDTNPKLLICHIETPDILFNGSRVLSAKPVRPWTDFEIQWTVAYLDDSPLEDNDGLVWPNTAIPFNPFTDQKKGNFYVPLRGDGDYNVTVTVRAKNGANTVREFSLTKTITVSANTWDTYWADYNSGLSGNDGLDAWGFSLDSGEYTESTKRLYSEGSFAGYDHAAATNDDRDTYKYNGIYLYNSDYDYVTFDGVDQWSSEGAANTSISAATPWSLVCSAAIHPTDGTDGILVQVNTTSSFQGNGIVVNTDGTLRFLNESLGSNDSLISYDDGITRDYEISWDTTNLVIKVDGQLVVTHASPSTNERSGVWGINLGCYIPNVTNTSPSAYLECNYYSVSLSQNSVILQEYSLSSGAAQESASIGSGTMTFRNLPSWGNDGESFPAGYYRIAAKISNDEIELEEGIGADWTNIKSSTGPKDAISNLTTGEQKWMVTGDFSLPETNIASSSVMLFGYGTTQPKWTCSSNPSNIISTGFGGSTSVSGIYSVIGNLYIDGEYLNKWADRSISSTGSGDVSLLFMDCKFKRGYDASNGVPFRIGTTGAGTWQRNSLIYNCELDLLYKDRLPVTTTGYTGNATTLAVNEDISSLPTSGVISITPYADNGYESYRTYQLPYTSKDDGTKTFTLEAPLPQDFIDASIALDSTSKIVAHADMFNAFNNLVQKHEGHFGCFMACTFDGDFEDDGKHHPIYPSGYISHLDISYNHFRNGIGGAFCANINMSSNVENKIHRYISAVGNYCSSSFRFGLDCSKTNNTVVDEWAEDVYFADNSSHVMTAFVYAGNIRYGRVCHNSHEDTEGINKPALFAFASFVGGDTSSFRVVDQNSVNGNALMRNYAGTTEVTENEVVVESDDYIMYLSDDMVSTENVYDGNTWAAPNQAAGDIVETTTPNTYTSDEFDALVTGTNTEENPFA